jgi:hypothetical protein
MVNLIVGIKDIIALRKIQYKLNKDLEDIDSFFYTYFKLNPKNANEYIMLENKIKTLDVNNPTVSEFISRVQRKNLSKEGEKVFIERSNAEWHKRKDIQADKETVNNAIVALEKLISQDKTSPERIEIVVTSFRITDEQVRFMVKG